MVAVTLSTQSDVAPEFSSIASAPGINSIKLFAHVNRTATSNNIVISPFSVSVSAFLSF